MTDVPPEEAIELRRNLASLRRGRNSIVLFVLLVTGATVGVSLLLPRTYQGRATIVVQDPVGAFGGSDVSTAQRGLETFQRLLSTDYVLAPAAKLLPGETASALRSKVSSSADPTANILEITAHAHSARAAAELANVVASTFLGEQRQAERARLTGAQMNVAAELVRQRAALASPAELAALESRIADIAVSRANVGQQLQLAQTAERPPSAYAPRPLRNGLVALFGALLLAVVWALARDRLAPRATSARELSQFLRLPILGVVPGAHSRFGPRRRLMGRVAEESYQSLRSWLRFELSSDRQQVILVTSAVEGERTSSVVAGLGRALAAAGHRTLLVSADLRFPTLHRLLGRAREPGFTDVLARGPLSVESAIVSVAPQLDLLPSGAASSDPVSLLTSDAFEQFLSAVDRLKYDYVLVEASPLLGVADAHGLARRLENVLLVSNLERLTFDDVIEARDALQRLQITPLGLIVVDADPPGAYAYSAARLVTDRPPSLG